MMLLGIATISVMHIGKPRPQHQDSLVPRKNWTLPINDRLLLANIQRNGN